MQFELYDAWLLMLNWPEMKILVVKLEMSTWHELWLAPVCFKNFRNLIY